MPCNRLINTAIGYIAFTAIILLALEIQHQGDEGALTQVVVVIQVSVRVRYIPIQQVLIILLLVIDLYCPIQQITILLLVLMQCLIILLEMVQR